MITDAELRPSHEQAVTTGTQVSTNAIDNRTGVNNLGRGERRRAFVAVTTPFAGGTSTKAQLIESDNADLSSPDVLIDGEVVAVADLVQGAVLMDEQMPDTSKRYIGFRYVTVGTHTAGKVDAFLVADTDYQPYLPANTGR